MPWTKLVDQVAERAPEVITAIAGAALVGAAWVGSIEYRLSGKAPASVEQEVVHVKESVAQDVSHMRDTLDKLKPVITQTAEDVAVLKDRSLNDKDLHKDTEQRLRDLERKP